MKWLIGGLSLLLLALLVLMLVPGPPSEPAFRIGVASSLEPSLGHALNEWADTKDEWVQVSFASSGHTSSRLRLGLDLDIVVLADAALADRLAADGYLQNLLPIAGNRLVVVAAPGGEATSDNWQELVVATGEPDVVPLGRYAKQAMGTSWDFVDLIFGGSARQVVSYVQQGQVDAAIVYATDAGDLAILHAFDPSLHDPILYVAAQVVHPSARVDGKPKPQLHEEVLDLLRSDEVRQTLLDAGFREVTP